MPSGTNHRDITRGVPLPGTAKALRENIIDTIKYPTNEDGRIIPVLFGTKRLKAPQLLWYGDCKILSESYKPTVQTEKMRGIGIDTSAPWWTRGNYVIGMHLGYCLGPIDKITKIEIKDVEIWSGECTGGLLNINAGIFRDGDNTVGGIYGDINIVVGHKNADYDSYLITKLAGVGADDFPNFSGIFSIIARRPTIGNKNEIDPWVVTAQRILYKSDDTEQWYPGKANIDGDMNPAHIVRECFSDKHFGMGYPDELIDDDTLEGTADTLYDEGFGMSMLIDAVCSVQDIINEVEKAVDGYVLFDRTIGKLTFKLRRKDYVVGNLPLIDDSGMVSIDSFSKETPDEIPNGVSITYWNKSEDKESKITIQDTALSILKNGTIIEDIEIKGVTTEANAMTAATRFLVKLAFPVAAIKFTADSQYSTLNKGDVFKLTSTDYGIDEVVFRIESINIGNYPDRKVIIIAFEESVDLEESIIDPPPATEWEPVSNPPDESPIRLLEDIPYYLLRCLLTEGQIAQINPIYGIAMYTGSAPTTDTINLAVKIDNVELQNRAYAAPAGTLETAIDKEDLTITSDIVLNECDYAQIDDEIIYVSEVTDLGDDTYEYDILRGCLDTVPATHEESADIISLMYIISDFLQKDGEVTGKLAPQTIQGLLSWDSAPEDSVEISDNCGRHYRPIVPGDMKLDNKYWPDTVIGETRISWAHRNRFYTDGITHFGLTGIESEPEVTYKIEIYAIDEYYEETLVYSESGITDNYHSFELEESGTIRIELCAERDGVESWQRQTHEVYYTAEPLTEGSFLTTLEGVVEGVSDPVQGTVKWAKKGRTVAMRIPQMQGNSVDNYLNITDIPSEIFPDTNDIYAACPDGAAFIDNGDALYGIPVLIEIVNNKIYFRKYSAWTNTGIKGIGQDIDLIYNLY